MGQKKGISKTGGRKKGTPNKITTDLKTWLSGLLDNNRQQFEKDLKKLEPHQRISVMEKLLSYAIPKMQSVEAQIDTRLEILTDEQIDIIINNLNTSINNE